MINVNFDTLLDTMSRSQILAMLEGQLDTAIAQKIERENADRLYKIAKANVANDTYTSDDLVVLQKRLNDVKRGHSHIVEKAKEKYRKEAQEPKIIAHAVAPEEVSGILKALGLSSDSIF